MPTTPINPPAEWFKPPSDIDPSKRLTVEDNGRVHGYVALWDTCHVGLPGCVKPPKTSPTDYEYAHVGETITDEGDALKTAVIAGSIPHPDPRVAADKVPDIYANTGKQLMRVRYGNDENGLWFAGALFPNVTDEDIVTIRASAVSGDWRFHSQWRETPSRGMDFSGAIMVNVPGFREDHDGSVNRASGRAHHLAASGFGTDTETPAVIIGLQDHYIAASAVGDSMSDDNTKTVTGGDDGCGCGGKDKPTTETTDDGDESITAGSFDGTADELFQMLVDHIAMALTDANTTDDGDDSADEDDDASSDEATPEDMAAVAAAAVVKALTAQADDAPDEQAAGEAIQALNMKVDQILDVVTQLNISNVEAQASALADDLTS